MVCKRIGPAGVMGIGRFWDDPKALARAMNEGIVLIDPALEMNGQVETQQSYRRNGV